MRFTTLSTIVTVAVASVRGAPAVQARDPTQSLDIASLFNGADLSESNNYGAPIPPWEPGCEPGWYYGPNPQDHPDLPSLGGSICQILDSIPIIGCPISTPPVSPGTSILSPVTSILSSITSILSPATSILSPVTSILSPATSILDPVTSDVPVVTVTPVVTSTVTPIVTATPPVVTITPTVTSVVTVTPVVTVTSTPPVVIVTSTPPVVTVTSSATPTASPSPSNGYTQTFSNMDGATQAGDYLTFGLVETVADCQAMCDTVSDCDFVNTYHDMNGKDGSPLLTCSLFTKCHGPEDSINKGGQTEPDGSVNYITDSDGWCKA